MSARNRDDAAGLRLSMAIAPPQRLVEGPLPGSRILAVARCAFRALFRVELVTPWSFCAFPMASKSPMQNQDSPAWGSGFTRDNGTNGTASAMQALIPQPS